MLGIYLLIILAGRPFYRLAVMHDKNKWLFGFLGIIVFFLASNISVFIIGILFLIFSSIDFSTYNENLLGLIGLPFGVLVCWLYYKYLSKKWANVAIYTGSEEVLDDAFLNKGE